MDEAELGFNAWVLIGNVLQTLLRGPGAFPDPPLSRLEALLEPVQPSQMLNAISSLSPDDRRLLLDACQHAFAAAGTEAQTTLGLGREDAAPVLALLF